ARLRAGGPGARAARPGDRAPAHPPELHGAAARAGHVHLRLRGAGGGDPRVPGGRGPALRAVVGERDRQRQERDPGGVLGEPLSRDHADRGRPQPEPPGRRPPRHPRSPPPRLGGDRHREIARMKLFDLTGKVAIVTGGNGGIGLGMARGLAQAGAAVVLAARNVGKSTDAVKELEAAGARAIMVKVDVRSEASCREMVQKAVDRFGRLDILVNNAGTNIRKRPEEYTVEEWHTVLDTNLTSAYMCAHAAYPHMGRAGGRKIINVGSMMSIFGAPFTAPYAASKGGMVQMTKAMATAWARDNIQVNAVLPGWIDTELTRQAR